MPEEKGILVLSVLDLEFEPHQRIMRIAKYLSREIGSKVSLIYKKAERNRGTKTVLKSMLTMEWHDSMDEKLRIRTLNPFWNIPLGVDIPYLTFLVEWFDVFSFIVAGLGILLGRTKFETCVVQGPVEAVAGLVFRKVGLVRFVIYDDFDYIPGWYTRKFRNRIMALTEVFTMKCVDEITCSGSLLSVLRRIQTKRIIHHVPNGVDLTLFGSKGEKPLKPSSDSVLNLVYAGNVSFSYSGLDLIMKAMEKCAAECSGKMSITIAGHGDPVDVNLLTKKVDELNSLGINARYMGPVKHEDVPSILRGNDIGLALFPPNRLRMFAFPYKVIEYMAVGLAVIGTRKTETARIIRKFGTGFCVNFDEDELTVLLSKLVSDPGHLEIVKKAGTESAIMYDWHLLLEKESEIILNVGEQ